MFSTVLTASMHGLEVEEIHVEADISNGLPVFHMVGYLSSEVKESAQRVRTAIRNADIMLPPKRVVINLAPADVRKTGASYDLPIALAVLASLGEIDPNILEGSLVVGELGLAGEVRKVPGILPIAQYAKEQGYRRIILPKENEKEALLIAGISVIGVNDLGSLCRELKKGRLPEGEKTSEGEWESRVQNLRSQGFCGKDFADVHGQIVAKRASMIAVAGFHNFLMVGPPGAGKTMIAERIAGILPDMNFEESMEVSKVYSIIGELSEDQPLILERPFRPVHHTVTKSALMGGGNVPRPGEISLAGNGILFLDELPEFKREVLETLRQPLENHVIRISRNRGIYEYPANFMLVAAMNPCPCGKFPDLNRCTCSDTEVKTYLNRISQPFLDRIDICIETPQSAYKELKQEQEKLTSKEMKRQVQVAWEMQNKRYENTKIRFNSRLTVKELNEYCKLDSNCESLMQKAYEQMHLTARSYHKVIRVARTIADLSGLEEIQELHLYEALGYRGINKKYWGGTA